MMDADQKHRWVHCPKCGKRLAKILGGRAEIEVDDVKVRAPLPCERWCVTCRDWRPVA
jgi:DNA-directed RNA polymerase subunit RPC12/RpoP